MAFSHVTPAASAHRIDSHRDIHAKMIMARSTACALTALLAMAMFASSAVAQTAPTDAVGTDALPVYSISTTEWSDDVPADPEATVVAVTSAGSCVCDLTAGSCDGNCCCDPDCTVRLLSTPWSPVPRPVVECLNECRFDSDLLPSASTVVHRARPLHRAFRRHHLDGVPRRGSEPSGSGFLRS